MNSKDRIYNVVTNITYQGLLCKKNYSTEMSDSIL